MDESAKTEARNYLSAAGFFIIAGVCLLVFLGMVLTGQQISQTAQTLLLFAGFGAIVVSILLFVCGKRDLVGILFMCFGIWQVCSSLIDAAAAQILLVVFMLFIALITLTAKDKKKWFLFVIPFLNVFPLVLAMAAGLDMNICISVFTGIAFLISLYYAFACACERVALPGAKLLTADEDTDFKASGSVFGYMLFALVSAAYAAYYLAGDAALPLECINSLNLVVSVMLMCLGVLLFAVGKMRFTPVMFFLLGLVSAFVNLCPKELLIGVGILLLVLGLFTILRKESRILPGIMILIYAVSAFFSCYAGQNMPVLSVILNLVPCLIAVYLAFAVYSQRKLPVF